MRFCMLSVAILPWCAGCVTVTAVLHEPLSEGRGYSYAAPAESVVTAAGQALTAQDLDLTRDTVVGSTRLLVGTQGVTPMSWGEISRVAITATATGAEVRVISRDVRALSPLHQDRSPWLFRELDRALHGSGVRPFAGDRVRVVLPGPPHRIETGIMLQAAGDGSFLTLETKDEARLIPAGDLVRLSISRGTYGHKQEGAIVGMLFGGITGFLLVAPEPSDNYGMARVAGLVFGSLIGGVVGGVAGAAIRTEVWSDIPPAALGPRPEQVVIPAPAHRGGPIPEREVE